MNRARERRRSRNVLAEFQHPQVGDTIGYGSNQMRIEIVDPEHVLTWRSEDGNWVWTFVIEERKMLLGIKLRDERLASG